MAYGGSKPLSFHQAICESQALEPGITGNFTADAMELVVDYVGCNATNVGSEEAIACLRKLDMETLLNASIATYQSDIAHNIGDVWLPSVDGDFLPAAPSTLIEEGRFADVTAMIGWCQDDVSAFTDVAITTPEDTRNFIQSYVPDVTSENIDSLLALYPSDDFTAKEAAHLSQEFWRTVEIFRDVLMTCLPMWYGKNLAQRGKDVYLYDWNQTILDPITAALYGQPGLGPFHTSEFAYIFGNLSTYDQPGFPYNPRPEDFSLRDRGSRSWSTYASTAHPSLSGHDTFRGFEPAFQGDDVYIFVAGGPNEGLSAIDGPHAKVEMEAQKLRERCGFINSPEIRKQLRY